MERSMVRKCMLWKERMLLEGKRERWAVNGQLYDTQSSSVLWLNPVHQIELLTHRKPSSSLCVCMHVCVRTKIYESSECLCVRTCTHINTHTCPDA